jgi:hypothetical protein
LTFPALECPRRDCQFRSPTIALLAALGTYGGQPRAAWIDAGISTGAPVLDQRGQARFGAVDIGAFESQGFTITVTSGSGQATESDATASFKADWSRPVFASEAAAALSAEPPMQVAFDGEFQSVPRGQQEFAAAAFPVPQDLQLVRDGQPISIATLGGSGAGSLPFTIIGLVKSIRFAMMADVVGGTVVNAGMIRVVANVHVPSLG